MANILIDMGHPSDVHIFRHAAQRLTALGHQVHYAALDREMILELLDRYQMPYTVTYRRRIGQSGLMREVPFRTWRTWQIARRQRSDLFIAVANPVVGLVARLLGKPFIAFQDTEPALNIIRLTLPFTTRLVTADVFYRDFGPQQTRHNSYHQLAYLHPDVYTPDASIFDVLGLERGAFYSVVRFVAWGATHDIGQRGFTAEDRLRVLRALSERGPVIFSSEEEMTPDVPNLIMDYPRERMHDLLAFAQLYVGEGNTMAAEAAVLGTPSIRVNTMDLGYCRDLEGRGLMFQRLDGEAILDKTNELLTLPERETHFEGLRQQMLRERAAMSEVIVREALQALGEPLPDAT